MRICIDVTHTHFHHDIDFEEDLIMANEALSTQLSALSSTLADKDAQIASLSTALGAAGSTEATDVSTAVSTAVDAEDNDVAAQISTALSAA